MTCGKCSAPVDGAAEMCTTCTSRSRTARKAVNTSWSRTANRTERTAAARANSPVSFEYWLRKVTDEGIVRAQDRVKAATNAHRAFQADMSQRAAATRAANRAQRLSRSTA